MRHTPGDWKSDSFNIYAPGEPDSSCLGGSRTTHICNKPKNKADACLIVAAPKMLEALKTLYAMYNDSERITFDLVEIRSILKSAIDKAESKS